MRKVGALAVRLINRCTRVSAGLNWRDVGLRLGRYVYDVRILMSWMVENVRKNVWICFHDQYLHYLYINIKYKYKISSNPSHSHSHLHLHSHLKNNHPCPIPPNPPLLLPYNPKLAQLPIYKLALFSNPPNILDW